MIVTALKHKTGGNIRKLLDLMGESLKSDIVVAPDYALAFDLNRPNSDDERKYVESELVAISKLRNEILIPGTMPIVEQGKMKLICPIYKNGDLIKVIQKETDRGEDKMATEKGLVYERGESKFNHFKLGNSKESGSVAVEICSDHGHQRIPEDTVLELILAYDTNAGFYIDVNTSRFARKIIVCDGYYPKIEGFNMDKDGKVDILKPSSENENWRTYSL